MISETFPMSNEQSDSVKNFFNSLVADTSPTNQSSPPMDKPCPSAGSQSPQDDVDQHNSTDSSSNANNSVENLFRMGNIPHLHPGLFPLNPPNPRLSELGLRPEFSLGINDLFQSFYRHSGLLENDDQTRNSSNRSAAEPEDLSLWVIYNFIGQKLQKIFYKKLKIKNFLEINFLQKKFFFFFLNLEFFRRERSRNENDDGNSGTANNWTFEEQFKQVSASYSTLYSVVYWMLIAWGNVSSKLVFFPFPYLFGNIWLNLNEFTKKGGQLNEGLVWETIITLSLQLYELSDDKKRKDWLDDWFTFMHQRGKPVTRIPIMAKQVLDLYELYRLVVQHGGLVEIINKKLWREITKGLNLPSSITSAAFTLRTQ